jgi:nitrogenase molybdenum-iron protein alpha/beta subunit
VAQAAENSQAVARANCVVVEGAGFSDTAAEGFQQALMAALESISPDPLPIMPQAVNLVGVSIQHRHWEGSLAELRRLLGLCGVQVGSVLSAGATVSELRNLRSARCNVVVYNEYGDGLARWLEGRCGMPYLALDGAPIGFEATERWVRSVASQVGADPTPAVEAIVDARRRAYPILARWSGLTGLPKGVTFGIHADASIALPLTQWLYAYLGMIPVAVTVKPSRDARPSKRLQEYLDEIDCAGACHTTMEDAAPELVIADEHLVMLMRESARSRGAPIVGISLSDGETVDVIPKSLLGARGALYLVEQIINGLDRAL